MIWTTRTRAEIGMSMLKVFRRPKRGSGCGVRHWEFSVIGNVSSLPRIPEKLGTQSALSISWSFLAPLELPVSSHISPLNICLRLLIVLGVRRCQETCSGEEKEKDCNIGTYGK